MYELRKRQRLRGMAGVINNIRLGGRSNNNSEVNATQADVERESRIEYLHAALQAAIETDERHVLFDRFKSEIASRSPAQIERLERERGLR